MSSQKRKHKRIHPMPVVSSFSPPNLDTVHSECITRQLTPEQLAEVIEKYGKPTMPLKTHRGHYMSSKKKGEKKNDSQIPGSKDRSGRDRVSKQA